METKIKFTVSVDDLKKALKVVSIVSPQAQASSPDRGYLFVVQGEECRIYSKNGSQEARSSFPISSVEGEGGFMYPADYISEFDFRKGSILFEVLSDDTAWKVKYTTDTGAGSERVSFDPGTMVSMERKIQEALSSEPKIFDVALIKDAIGTTKSFVAGDNDKTAADQHRTIQIFGDTEGPLAKGNGFMLASNNTRCCYYYTDAFKGNGLAVPGGEIGLMDKFLSRSSGALKVYETPKGYYLHNDKGDIVGWQHTVDTHKKFAYYAKKDQIVVRVDVAAMSDQLRFMRAAIPKDTNKIRIAFNSAEGTFKFSSVDAGGSSTSSDSIKVEEVLRCEVTPEEGGADFQTFVNVEYMLSLFSGLKGALTEFRVFIVTSQNRPKPAYMFRTIDEYLFNGTVVGGVLENAEEGTHGCTVTRFTPNIA